MSRTSAICSDLIERMIGTCKGYDWYLQFLIRFAYSSFVYKKTVYDGLGIK